MAKELTEKKVREIIMEGIEMVLKTLESYSSKEHTEEIAAKSELKITKKILESEKRIIKTIKPQVSRIDKLEQRVYKLENKAFN